MTPLPPVVLVDIAPLLALAATALDTNDLLHGPLFSLHEVMTAVEVGDVKLDAGCVGVAAGASDGVEALPLPEHPSAPHALATADGLLAAEAAWHAGGSMGTTLLPCLYLLRPDSASSCLFLHALCASLRGCCDAVRDLIVRGGVSEDEDFQLFPQEMPHPTAPEDVDKLMAEARAALASEDPLTALGLASTEKGAVTAPLLPLLAAHLDLRAALAAGITAAIALDFDTAVKSFQQAAGALKLLAAARPATLTTSSWPPPSFDPAAARAAVPPVPPRPDRAFTSVEEGLTSYKTALAHLAAAASLPAATATRGGGLRCALRALGDLVGLRPGAVPRSVGSLAMGLGVEPIGGTAPPTPRPSPGPWALTEAAVCASLALPPPDALPTESASTFVAQAALGLQGWGVACLLNPARSRRRMRRALEDWVHVHQHAAVAENDPLFMRWLMQHSGWAWPWPVGEIGGEEGAVVLPPPPPPDAPGSGAAGHASPLSAWVEEAGARCAGGHLLRGFGLSLYAPHEHVGVLWYGDYLARREAAAAEALAVRWPARKAAAGKKGKGAQPDPLGPPPTKADPVAAASAAADAAAASTKAALLQAALRAAAGLAAAGVTPVAPAPFNGPEDRFRARFGCLGGLTTPPPLGFPDFEAHVLTQLDAAASDPPRAADLVRGGKDGFAWARSALSAGGAAGCGLEEAAAAALARVAGANAVALGLLERDLKGFDVEYDSGGDSVGWMWAVKLKRRKGEGR